MKRILLCLILMGTTGILIAQRVVEKTYSVTKDQPVLLKFDFPKIKLSCWDKDEVYIKASVNINDNKQNDKFQLVDKTEGGQLTVSDTIDFKHIESVYYVEVDGVKKRFESKADFDNYKELHKDEKYASYNVTNDVDILIEIILPRKDYIKVKSKFGLVEIGDYNAPLTVETEFGKIVAKLKETNVGKITLTNHFGKIYSDFDLKPTQKEDRNFYTSITAEPGKGPTYSLTSKFGNIYLRNAK
ncbi:MULTISPECIES: hypothetical protein [Chitinophagaceae]